VKRAERGRIEAATATRPAALPLTRLRRASGALFTCWLFFRFHRS
jgi:hypothetical protein